MKKITFLIFSLLLVVSMSACTLKTPTNLNEAPSKTKIGLSAIEQKNWDEFVLKRRQTILTPKELKKKCDERVVEDSDLYGKGEVWPLVQERYPQQSLTDLGVLFASMDCGNEYVAKNLPVGVNHEGIYMTIFPGPSEKFRKTLNEIGFVFIEEGYRYQITYPNGVDKKEVKVLIPDSYHEDWELIDQVSLEKLKELKEFVDEPWSVDSGALRSQY